MRSAPMLRLRWPRPISPRDGSGEAIAFLVKADARDRLAALREEATQAGDAFLVRELSRALGEEPTPERWRSVHEAARAAGKERFAAQAHRLAEREAG
ncbi:MAG: hypothetical protein M5U32_15545 [Myxococcota bacterium]|nr:hypothetical protein [Myxococcota bacterium]